MRLVVLSVALAALSAPAAVAAQSLVLTEADALARLSPASPRVRAIRAGVEVARADILAAGRWPNPRVTFDRESVAGISETMTMVSQTIPLNGSRTLQFQAAGALADASANRIEDEVRRARADLRLSFVQLLAAQARERELTGLRDRLRALADILAKREAAGDAAGFDRLRAEREVMDVDADLSAARVDRARAQADVAGFFAEPLDAAAITAAGDLLAPPAPPSVDALLERAESTRGDLRALGDEMRAAGFAERAADRRRIPDPEVVAGAKSSTFGGGDVGSVVAIHATVPLFDRSRPERAMARARATQAEARLAAFRLALRADLAALRSALVERRGAAERYRAGAVPGADQIARIAQASYDAGERSLLELLDAYRTAASARVRQAALDAATAQAAVELEFLGGWEVPS